MRFFSRRKPPSSPVPGPARDDEDDATAVARIARTCLPAEVAPRWLALLRPAVRLVAATDDAPVVARLGGVPEVPAGFTWPQWPDHGPLTFVAEVDLDAVSAAGLDAGAELPTHGRLLAFYYDGSYHDDVDAVVGAWDPATLAGARLLHVDADRAACAPAAVPADLRVLPERRLAGRQTVTWPGWEHPALEKAFGATGQSHEKWMLHPVNDDVFDEALTAVRERDGQEWPGHQLGGWAAPVQGPVEDDVAQAALGGEDVTLGGREHQREAARWTLVLQVGSEPDDDAVWGDLGALYWLVRSEELPSLEGVSFTWQCT